MKQSESFLITQELKGHLARDAVLVEEDIRGLERQRREVLKMKDLRKMREELEKMELKMMELQGSGSELLRERLEKLSFFILSKKFQLMDEEKSKLSLLFPGEDEEQSLLIQKTELDTPIEAQKIKEISNKFLFVNFLLQKLSSIQTIEQQQLATTEALFDQ